MCVLIIAKNKLPSLSVLHDCEKDNNDGGGVAYRKNGLVHWHKGLSADEIYDLDLPLPAIIHFRMTSIGETTPELCHPFPISADVKLNIKGRTSGSVLFHNGHFSGWKDDLLQTVLAYKRKLPAGKWSDTRAIAYLAHYLGISYLNLAEGKFCVFTPTEIKTFGAFYKHEKCLYSNMTWQYPNKLPVANKSLTTTYYNSAFNERFAY